MKGSKSSLLLLAVLGLVLLLAATTSADPGNDTPEDATDVYDGSNEQHTVQAAGGGNPADDDWFRIYMNENHVLKLGCIFDPNNGWLYIDVFGPESSSRRVSTGMGRATDANAQEIDLFIFQNGTYYIKVYVADGDSCQYVMDVGAAAPDVLNSGVGVTNGQEVLRGHIDSSEWYRIWLEGDNQTAQMATAEMTWSGPSNAHIYVLDRKDDYSNTILNYSWSRSQDHSEDCTFGASYTGYYYIKVFTTTLYDDESKGVTFNLKVTILTQKHKADGNTVRSDAEFVDIRKDVYGKLVEAYDTHEWYYFYLNEEERFSAKATFSNPKLSTHWDYYSISVYAANGTLLEYETNAGTTGAPISVVSTTLLSAPYSGKYYLSLSAIYSYAGSGTTDYNNGRLVNTARYEMDMLIPNRKVWIVEPPGEVKMKEDAERTINLFDVFDDPENDELTFGVQGGKANFTFILSQRDGTLTIRPNQDWYGREMITVWAHDGRPDQKNSTTVTIIVESVADPPFVKKGAPQMVYIWEDEVNYTALDLENVFDDVDIEDRYLIYSVDKNEYIEGIEIDQSSGAVTLFAKENYHGEQTLTFYAADTYNYRASHQINVVVRPVNDPPTTVGKIPRISMEEGSNAHIDVGIYFEDIDEDELYYYAQWDQEDAIAFDNRDSNPLNSWFDIYPEDRNFYGYVQVIFVCYDRDPLDPKLTPEEARQSAILEVSNVNDPPIIDSEKPDGNPTIKELEYVVFEIDKIHDVDSTVFRYKWFVDDEEQIDVSGNTFQFPQSPSYNDAGTYLIRCEVKDSLGLPANREPEWMLVIENTNRKPSVNLISTDETVQEGTTITLKAEGYDQDDDSLLYTWYQINDKGQEQQVGLGKEFTFKSPLPPGSYRFKVVVDDGQGEEVPSEFVQIDVDAKSFPPTVPGFGAVIAIGLLAAVSLAMASRRRR